MKSLTVHLREMRVTERQFQHRDTISRKGRAVDSENDSDCYDDEFVLRPQRNKRRRLEA